MTAERLTAAPGGLLATGASLPAGVTEGGTVPATVSELDTLPAAATGGRALAQGGSTIKDVPAGAVEGDQERSQ